MELEKSKTWENLQTAFAGEAQAYTKYQWFAAQAKKEGYSYLSNIFSETAHNENVHAKVWFKKLNNGAVPDTLTCLKAARAGENFEYEEMYNDFEKVAKEEGFNDIARLFNQIGNIEHHHRDRYQDMINLMESGVMFKKPEPVTWICLNCGYLVTAAEPPKKCPVCQHPQGWFEVVTDYNQNIGVVQP